MKKFILLILLLMFIVSGNALRSQKAVEQGVAKDAKICNNHVVDIFKAVCIDEQNTKVLTLINLVRTSHGISALTEDDVTNNYGGDYI